MYNILLLTIAMCCNHHFSFCHFLTAYSLCFVLSGLRNLKLFVEYKPWSFLLCLFRHYTVNISRISSITLSFQTLWEDVLLSLMTVSTKTINPVLFGTEKSCHRPAFCFQLKPSPKLVLILFVTFVAINLISHRILPSLSGCNLIFYPLLPVLWGLG
jgi:hypothetical protein